MAKRRHFTFSELVVMRCSAYSTKCYFAERTPRTPQEHSEPKAVLREVGPPAKPQLLLQALESDRPPSLPCRDCLDTCREVALNAGIDLVVGG